MKNVDRDVFKVKNMNNYCTFHVPSRVSTNILGPHGCRVRETDEKIWGIEEQELAQTTQQKNMLTYEVVTGMGLPTKIVTVTKEFLNPNIATSEKDKENENLYKRELTNTLSFSNYKINSGEAKKFFQKKL